MRLVIHGLVAGLMCVCVAGCGAGTPNGGDTNPSESENIGEAMFQLMAVPSGVGCVRLTVTGSSTVSKDFTLAVGASTTTLNMDRLPLGAIAVTGDAYATTCGTGSTLYLADPVAATLRAGVINDIALTFRKNNPVNASVNFVGNVQAISTQNAVSYAVIDGNVFWWGQNPATGASSPVPTALAGLTGVAELSASAAGNTSCAVKTDGTLWCWGDNVAAEGGQSSPAVLAAPTRVGVEATWAMAGNGSDHSCAAQPASKTVKCFGSYYLGNGTTATSATPVVVTGVTQGVRSLAVGSYHACAVTGALDVRCWGNNSSGQLGDGTPTERLASVSAGASPAKQVVAGKAHTCVAMQDGTARCTGNNLEGSLGDGTGTSRSVFTPVTGLTGVDKLAAGASHTCALLTNGTVKCWGANGSGQLGDGSLTTRLTAVPVTLPGTVVLLSAGGNRTCAVTDVRDIYCWGDNSLGAVGDGTFVNSPIPVKVKAP